MHRRGLVILPPGAADAADRSAVEAAVEAVLEPYSEHLELEPYRRYPTPWDLGMSLILAVRSGRLSEALDLEIPELMPVAGEDPAAHAQRIEAFGTALAARLGPATTAAAIADGDRPVGWDTEGAYSISTTNPQGYWDWYQIGGRFAGYLAGDLDYEGSSHPSDILPRERWDAAAFARATDHEARTLLDRLSARERAEALGPDGDVEAWVARRCRPTFSMHLDADGSWHDSPTSPFPPRDTSAAAAEAWSDECLAAMEAAPPGAILVLVDLHD